MEKKWRVKGEEMGGDVMQGERVGEKRGTEGKGG